MVDLSIAFCMFTRPGKSAWSFQRMDHVRNTQLVKRVPRAFFAQRTPGSPEVSKSSPRFIGTTVLRKKQHNRRNKRNKHAVDTINFTIYFVQHSMDHFAVQFSRTSHTLVASTTQLHAADWNLLTAIFGFVWNVFLRRENQDFKNDSLVDWGVHRILFRQPPLDVFLVGGAF